MNRRPNPDTDLDIRSLRSFVAVAEELHFTRAATRLFVAQQALSRDIQTLETRLGVQLFVRTTRRVTLTPEGDRLLVTARELIRLHDQAVAELREPTRAVVVDLMSEGRRTGINVLEAARELAPTIEFRGRYGERWPHRCDACTRPSSTSPSDGHSGVDNEAPPRSIASCLRYEPLALLLPVDHPLAGRDAIPVAALTGLEIDANPAVPDAVEWSDLAIQFLALAGAHATPEHVSAVGLDDQAHHLLQQGLPILTSMDHVDVPGGVVRPIVEPVPIYCWSIAWRPGSHPAGLAAIREAAATMRGGNRWHELPTGAWLPRPEADT